MNKKISLTFLILVTGTLFLVELVAQSESNYYNLKVLPKNISTKELNKIMVDEFQDGLGVSCLFCHAENKTTGNPDYISDEKPEKQIARKMMKMTLQLNHKYFQVKHPAIGGQSEIVTCYTCHKGSARPGDE